jgi:dipeptidyl aminopeptidase/acylaminoacyl peptidase
MMRLRGARAWVGRAVCTALMIAALASVGQAAWAQKSAKYSVEDFFRTAELTQLKLSPNGRYVAGLRGHNGRVALSVVDLQTRKNLIITDYRDADVDTFSWVNDNRLIYTLDDLQAGEGGQRGGAGLFAINPDGTQPRVLIRRRLLTSDGDAPNAFSPWAVFAGLLKDGATDDVLINLHKKVGDRYDSNLYRVNTRTGRSVALSTGAPKDITKWVVDWDGVARVAFGTREEKGIVYYRESASAPWRLLKDFNIWKGEGFEPVAFGPDGSLYVTSYVGDKKALYRYDFAKNTVEQPFLFGHKDYDIDPGFVVDRAKRRILGIRYQADAMGTHWFDPGLQAAQAVVDQALPGRVNELRPAEAETAQRVLVASYSDVEPPSYYLYDAAGKRLEKIASSRKWIDPADMASIRLFRYPARDGLSIPAQLTVPKGANPKKLPLVVMVHGGPYMRGLHWAWDPQTQFLASRGYAVLEMDFRGSQGYGFEHFKKGWKQWGLAMQDDVADGVRFLVKEGTVDPKRVCIAGGSYGGYATVMGLIKDPDLYKCGISWVGVTDIRLMYSVGWSDFAESDWQAYGMPNLVGDLKTDAAQLKATSAVENADKLKQPLILAYGGADRRVPYEHGIQLRNALKPHNPNVEYIEYGEEGHGWNKLETNKDFWTRVEAFLNKHIGPAQ